MAGVSGRAGRTVSSYRDRGCAGKGRRRCGRGDAVPAGGGADPAGGGRGSSGGARGRESADVGGGWGTNFDLVGVGVEMLGI